MTTEQTKTSRAGRLRRLAEEGHGPAINAALDRIDEALRQPLPNQKRPLHLPALARHIEYYGLALAAAGKKGMPARLAPAWEKMAVDYATFLSDFSEPVAAHPKPVDDEGADPPATSTQEPFEPVVFENIVTKNDIMNLARFAVEKSQKARLCSSLLVFLQWSLEHHPDRQMRIEQYLPFEERDLVGRVLDSVIETVIEGADFELVAADPTAGRTNEWARMTFPADSGRRRQLEQFVREFRSPVDNGAHFICYRNGLTEPGRLVKSFLAILPPKPTAPESNWFRYVHVYALPTRGRKTKFGNGVVIPLEEGLYLVGGQRAQGGDDRSFRTAELMALSWDDVKDAEPIFGGSTLTSNYDYKPLVSRVALRATSIARSNLFPQPLDSFDVADLQEDLERDIAYELTERSQSFVSEDPSRQAAKILELANNCPEFWAVPGVYKEQDGSGAITTDSLDHLIERAFGSEEAPRFFDDDGHPFGFKQTIRFGGISRD